MAKERKPTDGEELPKSKGDLIKEKSNSIMESLPEVLRLTAEALHSANQEAKYKLHVLATEIEDIQKLINEVE